MRESDYLKNNEKVLRILREIDSFSPFSTEDIRSFLDLGKMIEFEAEEIIIQKGKKDSYIYFLLSGAIELVKDGEVIKTLRRTGELFGEMGVVDGSSPSVSVIARKKSLVLQLDKAIAGPDSSDKDLAFGYSVYRLFCEILAERLKVTTEENFTLKKQLDETKAA